MKNKKTSKALKEIARRTTTSLKLFNLLPGYRNYIIYSNKKLLEKQNKDKIEAIQKLSGAVEKTGRKIKGGQKMTEEKLKYLKGKLKANDIEAILEHFGYNREDTLDKNIAINPNPQYITPINALISSLLLLDKELEKGKAISLKFDYEANSNIGLLRYTIK